MKPHLLSERKARQASKLRHL